MSIFMVMERENSQIWRTTTELQVTNRAEESPNTTLNKTWVGSPEFNPLLLLVELDIIWIDSLLCFVTILCPSHCM